MRSSLNELPPFRSHEQAWRDVPGAVARRLRLAGTSGGKTPRLLLLPARRSDLYRSEGAFSFSSFPFFSGQSTWHNRFLFHFLEDGYLDKHFSCGNNPLVGSRARPEAEFPAVLMCSFNSPMEYFKGKLRRLLISSNVWLSLPRHEGRREKIKKQGDSVARPAGRSKAVIVQRVERIIVSDPGKSFAFYFSACQIQTVSAQLLWNCRVKSDIFIITIFALFFFCPCLGRVSKVKPPEPSAPEQLFCPLPNLVCSGFCPLEGVAADPQPLYHFHTPRSDSPTQICCCVHLR